MTVRSLVQGSRQPSVRTDPGVSTWNGPSVAARQWFARGQRVPYDPQAKKLVPNRKAADGREILNIFRLVDQPTHDDERTVWASFLPGWPDGSYGWSAVDRLLVGAEIGPRLFFDYVGHGDSDKPLDYPYGTVERADLVEALWEAEDVRRTFILGFDYSSIVALELLARQQERRERGEATRTEIVGVMLANGGLFADAHSHPWYTTPLLKSPMGGGFTALAQRSRFAFKELMKPLWSPDFVVSDGEIDQLREAIGRRNGVIALSRSAGFVDEHKRNAKRWDLERLFHGAAGSVAFHIVGSEEDPFENRQPLVARERLGAHGLDVRILPGGHLTTSERPELLAQIIEDVATRRV